MKDFGDPVEHLELKNKEIEKLKEELKKAQERCELLDDLVSKSAYVNERYAQDREQLKAHIRILIVEKKNYEAKITALEEKLSRKLN